MVKKFFCPSGGVVSPDALDNAVGAADIRLVKFLHQHHAPCTTRAMEWNAGNGDLRLVKFLHENRSEGCTAEAMDAAVMGGHLDVVTFLHFYRSEGCTAECLDEAIESDFHDVVRFLYEHYPHIFAARHMGDLLTHGFFDVWKSMCERFPGDVTNSIFNGIQCASLCWELPTIRFILNPAWERHPSAMNTLRLPSSLRMIEAHLKQRRGCGFLWSNTWPRSVLGTLETTLCSIHDFPAGQYSEFFLTTTAVYEKSVDMLKILREFPPGADERDFAGACTAAIQIGSLDLLQWLIENTDVPLESTLLDDAIYYHRRDIAEWLVLNCPETCKKFHDHGFTLLVCFVPGMMTR